jgi:hypothetical protein
MGLVAAQKVKGGEKPMEIRDQTSIMTRCLDIGTDKQSMLLVKENLYCGLALSLQPIQISGQILFT